MNLFNYGNYIINEALSSEEIEERKRLVLASHMRMYLSKGIADILKQMESPIANDLLTLSRKNLRFDISFMDKTDDKNGMVTYIQTSKVKKMEDGGLDVARARNDYGSTIWKSNLRVQPARIGKIVGKIFKDKYNKAKIEEFVNEFKSKETVDEKFKNMKVVYGDDIRKYYSWKEVEDPKSTLGSSCMRYDQCQVFFDIYTKNAPPVKSPAYSYAGLLLLFNNNNKVVGRAMVWFNVIIPAMLKNKSVPFRIFMDRVYTNQDKDQNIFKDYARKNDWLYKQQQTYNNAMFIDPLINAEKKFTITARLIPRNYNKYPFLDTMQYYTPETGRLSTTTPKVKRDGKYIRSKNYDVIRLQRTNGEYHHLD